MLPGLVKRQTINSCDYMPFVIYLFFLRNELGKVLPQFTVSEVLGHVFLMAARLRRQVEVLLQRPYPRCGPPWTAAAWKAALLSRVSCGADSAGYCL